MDVLAVHLNLAEAIPRHADTSIRDCLPFSFLLFQIKEVEEGCKIRLELRDGYAFATKDQA